MAEDQKPTALFQMSDKTYDFLNGLVKYVLPGAATLYLALAALWVLPYGEQVSGTIMAITTFLGIIIGISKRSYLALPPTYDGDVLVDAREEGEDLLTLALERPVEDIRNLDSVTFKVVRNSSPQE